MASLKRKAWHYHERRIVREEYGKTSTPAIAARLGRTIGSVTREAVRLKLTGRNHAPYRWTAKRRYQFLSLYQTDPEAAARQFGLTRMSANSYASRWAGGTIRRRFTPQEDAMLIAMWERHQDGELMARTGRSMLSLRNRAHRLGLRRKAIHDWVKWRFK